MSEQDDLVEQAYHLPPTTGGQLTYVRDGYKVVKDDGVSDLTDMQGIIHDAGRSFDFLLAKQRQIEQLWNRDIDPTDSEAVSGYIRDVVLCATDELHEVLAEVHWKPWKDKRGIKDIDKYREEMADVLHFILDLYLAAGLNGRDIVLDYLTKNYENVERNKDAGYRAS